MDDVLLVTILDRLGSSALDDDAQVLVLGACEGTYELEQALGGTPTPRPEPAPGAEAEAAEPPGAYLGPLTVEGFRGIGAPITLNLHPGPGLTLVVGRNGSGKSSFAEALEVLLTGDNRRWAARSAVWKEGWRNLHHTTKTAIEGVFLVEGSGTTTVARTWDADADITAGVATAQAKSKPRGPLEDLSWEEPLASYRPFLSYNELGTLLDEGPSVLYDALSSILGLEELVDAEELLAKERKARARHARESNEALRPLLAELENLEDERARTCFEALSETPPGFDVVAAVVIAAGGADLDEEVAMLRRLSTLQPPLALEDTDELTSALRDASAQLEGILASVAEQANETAAMLELALAFHAQHGDGDCPVCGAERALDASWHDTGASRLEEMQVQAEEARNVHNTATKVRRRALSVLVPPGMSFKDAEQLGLDGTRLHDAWTAWADVPADATLGELAAHVERDVVPLVEALEEFREEARLALERREDAWRPIAGRLSAWLADARDATAGAEAVPSLRAAEYWLKDTTDQLRAERFAPIAEQAKAIWNTLRVQSNVELVSVTLEGAATRRRVELEVNVDGVAGAALGVMSQGELHSLALSLFFPRAALPRAPSVSS